MSELAIQELLDLEAAADYHLWQAELEAIAERSN